MDQSCRLNGIEYILMTLTAYIFEFECQSLKTFKLERKTKIEKYVARFN